MCRDQAFEDEFHLVLYCYTLVDVSTNMFLDIHEKVGIDMYGPKQKALKQLLVKTHVKLYARHLES